MARNSMSGMLNSVRALADNEWRDKHINIALIKLKLVILSSADFGVNVRNT